MTQHEARNLLVENLPKDVFFSKISRVRDDDDDVTIWSCDLFDLHTGQGCGSAWFSEHYGEIEIDWL
mgnify:CR=1 FL=1